jgi:hypothetical protein
MFARGHKGPLYLYIVSPDFKLRHYLGTPKFPKHELLIYTDPFA